MRTELERLAVDDAARRLERELGREPEPRPEPALVVLGAGALFLAIFGARLAVDDPPALIANFYTVPTALLAVSYGVRAGLLGALISTALVFLWEVVQPVDVSVLGYASRIAVVVIVGAIVGYYSERLRADILRRHEAERELAVRAEDLTRSGNLLQEAVRRLDALVTIARAAGSETDPLRSLTRIVEQGRSLAGGAALSIWLRDDDRLVAVAASPPVDEDSQMPAGGIRVPLEHRGELLGTLHAEPAPESRPPDPDLLAAIAASAATAVVTARSIAADRLRDAIAASERERTRWAWELHDQTLQKLVGLRVLLSSAIRSDDPDALVSAAREALEEIRVETSNLKHLIAELRPAALDELGLAPALADLCNRVAATSGVEVSHSVDLDGDVLLPELECTIYRIAQEALTNTGKHSAGEHAKLTVSRRDGMVDVEVADDGGGFDDVIAGDGFGLRGMRERADLAGGQFDVRSGPDGTTVLASLPVLTPLALRPAVLDRDPRTPQTTTQSV